MTSTTIRSRMLFPFTVVGISIFNGVPWTAHVHAYDPATAVEVALKAREPGDRIAAVFRDHHEDIRP